MKKNWVPSKQRKILKGQQFGKLTVISNEYFVSGSSKSKTTQKIRYHKKRHVDCICECKKQTSPQAYHLLVGHTLSCGCLTKENNTHLRKYFLAKDGIKQCSICFEYKPISEYSKKTRNKDGLDQRCFDCERERWLQKRYKISTDDYLSMLKSQNFKCACCGIENPKCLKLKTRERTNLPFVVDHDHKTNKVRGLLCHKCNMGIGALGDDLLGVQNAINYLSKH